eukprot:Sspe_Gene.47457::Locus_24179_Transcript_1_1_Confidence_1.000_Length_2137::g.47457::m.47457
MDHVSLVHCIVRPLHSAAQGLHQTVRDVSGNDFCIHCAARVMAGEGDALLVHRKELLRCFMQLVQLPSYRDAFPVIFDAVCKVMLVTECEAMWEDALCLADLLYKGCSALRGSHLLDFLARAFDSLPWTDCEGVLCLLSVLLDNDPSIIEGLMVHHPPLLDHLASGIAVAPPAARATLVYVVLKAVSFAPLDEVFPMQWRSVLPSVVRVMAEGGTGPEAKRFVEGVVAILNTLVGVRDVDVQLLLPEVPVVQALSKSLLQWGGAVQDAVMHLIVKMVQSGEQFVDLLSAELLVDCVLECVAPAKSQLLEKVCVFLEVVAEAQKPLPSHAFEVLSDKGLHLLHGDGDPTAVLDALAVLCDRLPLPDAARDYLPPLLHQTARKSKGLFTAAAFVRAGGGDCEVMVDLLGEVPCESPCLGFLALVDAAMDGGGALQRAGGKAVTREALQKCVAEWRSLPTSSDERIEHGVLLGGVIGGVLRNGDADHLLDSGVFDVIFSTFGEMTLPEPSRAALLAALRAMASAAGGGPRSVMEEWDEVFSIETTPTTADHLYDCCAAPVTSPATAARQVVSVELLRLGMQQHGTGPFFHIEDALWALLSLAGNLSPTDGLVEHLSLEMCDHVVSTVAALLADHMHATLERDGPSDMASLMSLVRCAVATELWGPSGRSIVPPAVLELLLRSAKGAVSRVEAVIVQAAFTDAAWL